MAETETCAGCGGVISRTRRFTLATSIANHAATCPRRGLPPTKKEKDQ